MMKIKIGKIELKNPVMVASGTFGYAKEFEKLVNLKHLGAIITKTITLNPRQGNPMPRICETASGMLNAIGLQNEGIDDFIKEKMPYLSKIGVPIIISISGNNIDEFFILARRLNKIKAISGIELNISCPNIKCRGLVAQDKKETYEVVKAVRKTTSKTVITKLSPNVTDITEIAKAAEDAGSDAVSLVNTFLGMAIDVETGKSKLGNITGGLSGPCIKPIALRMVHEVSRNIDIPVIGMGGIMNAGDAIEFILAGATAIQVGTANFIEPGVSGKIIKGIEAYLKKHKIKKFQDIIGRTT
ncbi:MAG: dihydroorotate dehydrogenase [Candidatus Omnitrophica bacterium CG_4_9_14_0_2_um_filter_42_8]|nr:MAG: dihydroorotate dehydrogenase B catalytic subunit [Candidatus Omnitrophica bacterium CG22_combo_CG10-13_8_21_14_all_43_16]PJC48188.1 MAG: dihydroorotate dehydrogenase [Candidatus Omnitrophica bacterium CG_4_9_14_0_2_um_filter_42_8]